MVVRRPGDPPITPALVAEHGLTDEEYARIVALLGRPPTFTELGVFSALWSEHCGYKNSRPLLRLLPTQAPWVLQGPGENAGVIDVGDGWAVAFKIESHNHPSAVEPYQGAATGVGGILRDVFTMGARPIALLNSLRFGELDGPDADRVRYLLAGVVKGIGDYGNCVGVPTVGGEVAFDDAYAANPIVNAMAIGVLRREHLVRAVAAGPGNLLLVLGARTGRDGIHGATFASAELDEAAAERRPQVQIGDPFTEKLLLEASLELVERRLVVGLQDMGAAGLVSSSAEMAARAGTGVEIEITCVPTREPGMTPYEILLSETQERMLAVVPTENEAAVREVAAKWGLEAATIGRVTDTGRYVVREQGRVIVDLPGEPLVRGCPTYTRPAREAPEVIARRRWRLEELRPRPEEADPAWTLRRLLDAPTIASKRWVYEQYDSTVRTGTVRGPGAADAAVLRLRGTRRGIAAAVDGNGRYVYLHPYRGAQIAVAEAARNVACVGARPRAVTDNLNFGNPLKPEAYYALRQAVHGLADACRALELPVISGNVSLYNESPRGAIYPTPVVGVVGLLEDVEAALGLGFQEPGDVVLLFGENRPELGGSEYLKTIHGIVAGEPPEVDLAAERLLHELLVGLTAEGRLRSAHDCAEGGLAVALVESAIADPARPLGLDIVLEDDLPLTALLFGETQGRVIVSCAPDQVGAVETRARELGVPVRRLGTVGEPFGRVRIRAPGAGVDAAAAELSTIYENALPRRLDRAPTEADAAGVAEEARG